MKNVVAGIILYSQTSSRGAETLETMGVNELKNTDFVAEEKQ